MDRNPIYLKEFNIIVCIYRLFYWNKFCVLCDAHIAYAHFINGMLVEADFEINLGGDVMRSIFKIMFIIALIIFVNDAFSASIERCSEITKKCIIKIDQGNVGNKVKVLNERAHIVGSGKIIYIKKPFAIIYLEDIRQNIRKGYPVIIEIFNEHSNLHWAASFGDINETKDKK